ncbi:hypothetical protein F5884DRAFT_215954 [Xylogone sp. PMI_703]|nr:hypothetical protein F5884DRAFT_215954 [Xylogone sp. PMI_703]
MTNPNQYFLLADHIKLSLLERQRAISLNLESTAQDGNISRSLESLREGLESIAKERVRLQEAGESDAATALQDTEETLRQQYEDLSSQFTSNSVIASLKPNDPALAGDFARAADLRVPSGSSLLKKSLRDGNNIAAPSPKSVRFSDVPSVLEDENRAALFPYRDDPEAGPPDQSHMDNQQIHAYHTQVLAEQDEALDRLGESISRQRELSIQMGDELDEHVEMLDEIDRHVDRHQSRLDKARNSLGKVARKAKDNMQMTIIVILIIILVLLIIILK